MELYVHLPFCKQKCRYCDFPSWAGCEAIMPRYVDALLAEADRYGHASIETIYIGGGTPSLLPAPLMRKLLTGLHSRFDIQEEIEWSCEANPGTLTEAWLQAAADGGVNRLSLGMQAFQPELLKTLGRIHTFEQVETSVKLARGAGVKNLNLDLMFGLPGQTPDMWHETLKRALSLAPEHLSCYGLIPEEGTPLIDDLDAGRLTLPDEDDERRMYDDTLTLLSAHGFKQYEISNFALPGYECRHNIGYWQQIPYIGLGVSAASCLPADGCAYERLANPASLEDYLNGAPPTRERVSSAGARFETLMLGLRMTEGISEDRFQSMHGVALNDCYGDRLRDLAQHGLISWQGGWCRLTRRGMDVQNAILVELMD